MPGMKAFGSLGLRGEVDLDLCYQKSALDKSWRPA